MNKIDKLKEDMGRHSLSEYPRECVGIITKDFDYIPCKNISESPTTNFILDPVPLVIHDGNIWGIYHSHPGEELPIPSDEDALGASFDEYRFIVGFKDKFFIYWLSSKSRKLRFEPLEEKHFES